MAVGRNVKICRVFSTPTSVYGASSEDSSYPQSNIINLRYPLRPFKTQNISSQHYVRLAVNTSPAIKGILIRHTNCRTVQVRTSATSTSFPGTGDVNLSLGPVKDKRVNRYNYISTRSTTASAEGTMNSNDPYWEIKFMDTGGTHDGANVFSLGSIYLFTVVDQINYGFQSPFKGRRIKQRVRLDRASGSFSVIDFNIPRMYFSSPLTIPAGIAADPDNFGSDYATSGEEQIYNMAEASDEEGFILWENRVREDNQLYSRAYHVILASDIEISFEPTDLVADAGIIEYEEVI